MTALDPRTGPVDVRGLGTPGALIVLAKEVRFLSRGTRVDVHVDNEFARIDVAAWSRWMGHALAGDAPHEDGPGRILTLVLHTGRRGGD